MQNNLFLAHGHLAMDIIKFSLIVVIAAGCVGSDIPQLLKRAGKAYNYEDYRSSINYLTDYLEKSAENMTDKERYYRSVAFYYRGQSMRGCLSSVDYRAIGDFDESIKYRFCAGNASSHLSNAIIDDYNRALALNPNFFYAAFHLGLEYLLNGCLDNAEMAFANAFQGIDSMDADAKEKLWVSSELQDYHRLISYYYGMMLLRNMKNHDSAELKKIAKLLSNDDGEFKDASSLFSAALAGDLERSRLEAIHKDWCSKQSVVIKDHYFDILNKKRMALNLANMKRFLGHYRAKNFRFIVDCIGGYSRYDLKTMNMEVGDNYLIIRSVNGEETARVRNATKKNKFTEWRYVKCSTGLQLSGAYGGKPVVLFQGEKDLPVEYCSKCITHKEHAIVVHSLCKGVFYCVVITNPVEYGELSDRLTSSSCLQWMMRLKHGGMSLLALRMIREKR